MGGGIGDKAAASRAQRKLTSGKVPLEKTLEMG